MDFKPVSVWFAFNSQRRAQSWAHEAAKRSRKAKAGTLTRPDFFGWPSVIEFLDLFYDLHSIVVFRQEKFNKIFKESTESDSGMIH